MSGYVWFYKYKQALSIDMLCSKDLSITNHLCCMVEKVLNLASEKSRFHSHLLSSSSVTLGKSLNLFGFHFLNNGVGPDERARLLVTLHSCILIFSMYSL